MSVLSHRLAQVAARRPRRLVFDLAQVHFIDCAATRLIASAADYLPAWPTTRSSVTPARPSAGSWTSPTWPPPAKSKTNRSAPAAML